MSEYENELASERAYVAGLYARLDAERDRARRRYADALRDHERVEGWKQLEIEGGREEGI